MRILFLIILLLSQFNVCVFSQAGPVLSEFMAINKTILADKDGDYSDWIEIHNRGTVTVNLKGWTLTDSRNKPARWTFPDVNIRGGGFLVVFASGKDRTDPGAELHTNFRLDGAGEYLAFRSPDGVAVNELSGGYPAQKEDVSYGFLSGPLPDFLFPSPGSLNRYLWGPEIPAPSFSVAHGIFEQPFGLGISGSVPGSDIYYTVDGSEPSEADIPYKGPIIISSGTVLRAVEIVSGRKPSAIQTATYLFLNDILNQPDRPEGYPERWGPFTGISGTAPGDYGMDTEITGTPGALVELKEAFAFLPVISIATNRDFLFSSENDPDSGGIYIYTGPPLTNVLDGAGSGWERPASVEMFSSDGSLSFQTNCGLKLHGGHSRRAEKSPKHSFRLEFNEVYGSGPLQVPLFGEKGVAEYKEIILRAGFNNTWIHHSSSERIRASYIADAWAKETHARMGHKSMSGIFAHLFINGIYWGIYNPSERPDEDLMADYFGGEPDDYDIIKDYAEVSGGTSEEWDRLMLMANAGLTSNVSYQRIQGKNSSGEYDQSLRPMIDAVSLADYMILNFYAGNTDWDHHNWLAARNRTNPGRGFQFFVWDAEKILEDTSLNILAENNSNRPSRLFQQMIMNQEFKRLFADRVQKFCFENGPLTTLSATQLWQELSGRISEAVIAESARWGDYRRDVHRWQSAGPFDLYTYEDHWIPEYNRMIDEYFPARTEIFISQLQEAGWFPALGAPGYFINNERVRSDVIGKNDILSMKADSGDIYYTIDGSDPVIWQQKPAISPSARKYRESLILSRPVQVKARTYYQGSWSAMNERHFIIPDEYSNLKLTEINYFPLTRSFDYEKDIEFVEIKNTGSSVLPLMNVSFSEGIRYRFGEGSVIAPGEFIVLSSNPKKFAEEYGFVPYGLYSGHLDNEGERITLTDPFGRDITSVSYSGSDAWPSEARGTGKSLVPVSVNAEGDQDSPGQWRSSYLFGGSPGRDDIYNPGGVEELIHNDLVTLLPPYPNPANEFVYIPYRLKSDSYVELSAYTLTGIKVIDIYKGYRPAGEYVEIWKPSSMAVITNNNGGMYLYRLTVDSGNFRGGLTGKVIFIK